MRLPSHASVADSLARLGGEEEREFALRDGSRVAVIGGGPAGSFFAYFLRKLGQVIDLDLRVEIFEPRSFRYCGPAGCNHCGGIVSESLVQILAAEGIILPRTVVQRGVQSYVVHMDVGDVEIDSPVHERRIAALYRGNGPRGGGSASLESFDGFLQALAVEHGARVRQQLITGLSRDAGQPLLQLADRSSERYELVAVTTGVNSRFLESLAAAPDGFRAPRTTRAYICEFHSSQAEMRAVLGNSVHVFLLDIPRFEFAAIVPKGEFATVVMVGEDLDEQLVQRFLTDPVVRRALPTDAIPCVCSCRPLINLGARSRPYGDRVVLVGDSGVTRLYKDGIGAAFRTAKAAAETAVFNGVSAQDFERHFWPACRRIARDNAVGRVMFATNALMKRSRITRRAMLRMAQREQQCAGSRPHMSSLLWNMFTGSAPYTEMFLGTLHPGFITGLLGSLVAGLKGEGAGVRPVKGRGK